MTFEAFEVVVVPFPFTDRTTTKRRPALVLSDAKAFNRQVGQSVLAMITRARWLSANHCPAIAMSFCLRGENPDGPKACRKGRQRRRLL